MAIPQPTHWLISRDEIVIAEIVALVGVLLWTLALGWFVVTDALRARSRRRTRPRTPRKHFHLHRR